MPAARKARWNELLAMVGRGLMVRTDSREVSPGEVFALMPAAGDKSATYLAQALEKGAAWIVAGTGVVLPNSAKARLMTVPDVPEALGQLAAKHFRTLEQGMQAVAITGTNGKTTISYLLEGLLTAAGRKVGVLGTVSYRWPGTTIEANLTTPGCWRLHELFSRMSADGVDTVVMETSSHALHQKRVAGLEFDAAVLINLTQDHLDYHGDFEEYYQAKKMLFASYPRQDKFKAANADDAFGLRLLSEQPDAVGFTLCRAKASGNRMLYGELVSCTGKGVSLRMEFEGKCWTLDSGLVGAHNASNLMAAQAVGLGLGLGPADMQALKPFTGVPGRLERVLNDQGLDIFVDYAHTPDALINVLGALRALKFSRVITVFGCGGDRDRTKRPLMAQAVAKLSDVAVLTSDNPRFEDPLQIIADARPGLQNGPADLVIIEEPDRYEALRKAVGLMRPGDVLLVAGKGHEDYQLIGGVKHPFSDVEAVGRAIREVHGGVRA
ncbi:MAG: UDP-N-acetylmuramoyl-L-alanyl-D-glutamate--2,6-diaminopimelate ligase [Humidesulfovibrio sp.]|uniref:UDP-N-acetylmuramoyl-L-alanyl-D-glutamate--2, 6-diaminopimelate ligase n=1 Tax=Humidesulfovibrio sp. TaxID=2910988 RepID=UPI0027E5C088|nr:UDP-N-acetylmuramoyl-L-alanyl-D-glutamate--2,6-diaminopimelate ligase [Humidesulfovibrio sp.]MDQ7834604.1 UDP-N-acetylmuramoyl-L-alanyl-D-glutamate--2,6-diaminopimelate ligase [Humidesulfovibrio sp.]